MQNIAKIDFQPGIQKDRSPLGSEPGWIDSQWIRFRAEKPESMGGYTAFTGSPDLSTAANAAHVWNDLQGDKWLAFGGTGSVKVVSSAGAITDVSPIVVGQVPTTATVSTVSGETTYTVYWPNHGFFVGDVVTNFTTSGGVDVDTGQTEAFTVATVTNENYFTYTGSAAGSTQTNAFKASTYYTSTLNATAWDLQNFGEDLVALARGSKLFRFDLDAIGSSAYDLQKDTYDGAGTDFADGTGTVYYEATDSAFILETSTLYKITFTAARDNEDAAATYGAMYPVFFKDSDNTFYNPFTGVSKSTTTPDAWTDTPGNWANYFSVKTAGNAASTTLTFYVVSPPVTGYSFGWYLDAADMTGVDPGTITKVAKLSVVPNAPTRSIGMFVDPNRFVVLLGTVDAAGTYNPLMVRWCDQEDITDWTPLPDNLSGEQPIGQGAQLISGIATRGQNLLWTESDAHVMQYTGDPATVFSFQPLASNCGIVSYRSFSADNSGAVYWMSRVGQFFRFAGGSVEPIPCTVLRDVYDNIASSYLDKIHVGHNPAFQEFFFFYPDSRDSATTATRYAKVCYGTGVWDTGTFACSAWLPNGIFSYPIAVDNDGDVLFMENGNDANGSSLTTSITSSYFDIEDGGNLAWIERIIPDFDDQQGNVLFNFNLKMYPNATATTKGPYTATTTTRKLDMIFTARQLQVVISSAADPSFWRLGALRFDIRKSGSKR